MAQSLLEMAKDLVMAQIQAGTLPPEDMHKELQRTYACFMELKAREESGSLGPYWLPHSLRIFDLMEGVWLIRPNGGEASRNIRLNVLNVGPRLSNFRSGI